MKRIVSLLLVSMLALSLMACADTNGGTVYKPANADELFKGLSAQPAATAEAEAGEPAEAAAAAATEGESFAQYPILLTSGGQSADYQMISTVMGKMNMDFQVNNLATSKDIGDAKTLIVVVGGSSKGLGAAGIDANGELARLKELLDGAKAGGLKTVVMHTGGEARRGDLSDKFIEPVFSYADYAIIVSSGDKDGLMKGICESNGVEYAEIDSISKVTGVLPELFAAKAAAAPAAEAPAEAAAPEAAGESFAQYPILLTSGGQSADYQMIGTVMGKLKMDYTVNNLATSKDLGDAKTLIVVVGGSSKGLGAAGIDANGELARLKELLDGAKAAGLKTVVMHTGGEARRGDLSDKFIAPVFGYADYAIIVSSGDKDGLMKGICEDNKIEYAEIASISKVTEVLPELFAAKAAAAPAAAAPAAAPAKEAAPAASAEAPKTEEKAAEPEKKGSAFAEYPIVLTSGGQSADYQMIGTVMKKLNMDYTLSNLATSKDLGDAKTLIVVVGGSSKGLGAAGIDANGELARLKELLDGAKSAGVKVIVMHTGGEARRGDLSDKFIAPVFSSADHAIIVAAGDKDGLMKGICEDNKIPYDEIDSISKVTEVLPALFN